MDNRIRAGAPVTPKLGFHPCAKHVLVVTDLLQDLDFPSGFGVKAYCHDCKEMHYDNIVSWSFREDIDKKEWLFNMHRLVFFFRLTAKQSTRVADVLSEVLKEESFDPP
jgi:hypothetical protein